VLVVDASVAVKWFYPEKDTDKADAILYSGKKLIAPEIIRIEVAAALMRLLRMQSLDLDMAKILLDDWRKSLFHATVSLEPTLLDFDTATDISILIRHQLQDCLYIAVAARLGAPLITADKKLFEKAANVECQLLSLSDIL